MSTSLSNWVEIIICWVDFLLLYFCSFLLVLIFIQHYPHLNQTDLFWIPFCMTRFFLAPHNEERGDFVYSIYQLIHQTQFGLVFIFGTDLLLLSISLLLPLSHTHAHHSILLSLCVYIPVFASVFSVDG